jgi:hypothetical protein
MSEISDVDINAFWKWFVVVSDQFGNQFENSKLINELDQRITSLGGFTWEIGPGIINPSNSSLVISPCGDRKKLRSTKKIVDKSPSCVGWEFYPAKMPKNWDRKFVIQIQPGQELQVNASQWRYALLKYPGNTFDIIVRAPELLNFDDDARCQAVEIVLDSELGEEQSLLWIGGIEIVSKYDDDLANKSNPIEHLSAHFKELIQGLTIPS